MATKPKYTGVTPIDGGWQYRIKMKVNGELIDTRIKKDSDGLPFLTARSAYEARKAHEERLRAKPVEMPPEAPRATVSDVYNNYMNTEALKKAPATLRKQDSMWRNYIEPRFGDRDINSITIVELDSFLYEVYKDHSFKYVEGFLKFFYLIFGHADRMEVMDSDRYLKMFVTRGTRLQMPEMTQLDYEEEQEGAVVYTDKELDLIEKEFKSEDGNLLLAYYLGLYCGLRISETFALRWRNIDFDNNTITIDRQLQYLDGRICLVPVKTLKGVRKVYFTDDFKEELWFHYSYQKQKMQECPEDFRNYERVYDTLEKRWLEDSERDFVNRKKNGELLTVNSMKYWTRKINPVLKKYAEDMAQLKKMANAGIETKVKVKEFKYHSLRHTYATRCAMKNIPIFVLMQMLGHKKIDTTKRYYINIDDDFVKEQTMELLETLYKK